MSDPESETNRTMTLHLPASGTAPPPALRSWHYDFSRFLQHDLLRLVLVLVIAFVLERLVAFFTGRLVRLANRQGETFERSAQLRTLASIVRATSFAVIGFVVLLEVLSIFSINLTPLLASAGVVGVGIGLGAQSIFKDMLNGIFILVENQYNVGEVVKIAGLTGTVEDLSLRITRLREGDGTLTVIPNSQISTVANLSRDYAVATLAVSVDATASPDQVIRALQEIAGEVRTDPAFRDMILSDPTVPGLEKISGRELVYPVHLRVRPNQRDGVLRELRRRVILTFEREGIPLGSDSSLLVLPSAKAPAPAPQGNNTGSPQQSKDA